jgi:hypothetical protein
MAHILIALLLQQVDTAVRIAEPHYFFVGNKAKHTMNNKATSLGTLSRLRDKNIFKILSFLHCRDLLECGAASWSLFVACNAEELWRALVLLDYVDENKVAQFCFKGSWKATYRSPTDDRGWHDLEPPFPLTSSSSINCWSRNRNCALMPPSYASFEVRESFLYYNVKGMNLFQLPMNLVGIDRRGPMSRSEFVELYEKPNRPVLITGVMDKWPAMTRWRLSTLVGNHPEMLLKTNSRSTNGKRFRMRLRDFISYCDRWNGEKPLYIFDKKVIQNIDLSGDYTVPDLFSEDLFELMEEDDRPDYKWILIGPNGSGSPFHTDPHDTSAWNGVVEGCKRVSFYPPEVVPPGVDEDLIHSEYYASEDTMEWYRSVYPTLPTSRLPMECLVHPGEMLFIPSGWWHQVQNIGHTVAVTQNFCSLITFPRVASHMNAHAGKNVRKDFKIALSESEEFHHLSAEIVVNKKHTRCSK